MLRAIGGTMRDQGEDLLSWRPISAASRRSYPEFADREDASAWDTFRRALF